MEKLNKVKVILGQMGNARMYFVVIDKYFWRSDAKLSLIAVVSLWLKYYKKASLAASENTFLISNFCDAIYLNKIRQGV